VKICGITRLEDAELAVELGAAALGFIFWPGSPRFIDPHRARAIMRMLTPFVVPVGVFVDQPQEHVNEVIALAGLGAAQLHGRETPAYCAGIRQRVIRAIGVDSTVEPSTLTTWPAEITLLLDARDDERHGGTGRSIDWSLAGRVAARRPVILAGGLHAGNVGAAVDAVRPYAVDVSSGVEARPGVKDPDRMRALFRAIEAVRS
jgi:phosphoribosylanthranilate isomerase